MPPIPYLDKETLNRYEGPYALLGQEVRVFTKNETILYVFVLGQSEYELVPVVTHKFNFKVLEGFKVQSVDSDNGIMQVKFVQPNRTFTATRVTE